MNKSMLIVVLLGLSVFGLQAFTGHPPKYKNLQVLPQDISKQGLDSVMHHFENSLDVKCSFCHARNEQTGKLDFPSDAKVEKQIARGMMRMAIDINKNYFAPHDESLKNQANPDTVSVHYMLKYVTCYTCHHGNAHPATIPPKFEN